MLERYDPPSWKLSSLRMNSYFEKKRNPLPRPYPTPTRKSLPENVCTLHNKHYYQSINNFMGPYKMKRKCPDGVKEKKRREKKRKNQNMTNNTK